LPEAADACVRNGVEFLPGVEISSRAGSKELHILGLGVDAADPNLTATLARMAQARAERAKKMVERLVELGVPVSWGDIASRAGGVVGRMHIAQAIVATGHVQTIQDAFDKYIKAGRPAYVPREVLSPREAVDAIHAAGGLAFVAHPGVGDLESRLETLLVEAFDGIEVYHSKHAPHQRERFAAIAAERGLMVTGGSDCHGNVKGDGLLMGRVRVPYEVFDAIRTRVQA
jgi:predicted metal-dependent phosphoesterase TrpH